MVNMYHPRSPCVASFSGSTYARTGLGLYYHSLRSARKPERLVVRASEDSNNNENSEGRQAAALFQKELQRRREMAEKASTSRGTATTEPPPPQTEEQLERSRKLNSEGLEGLIPRATQLVKLGGSFFLAFGPVILVISILFAGIFLVKGDRFVHGGRKGMPLPEYIDPYTLLEEDRDRPDMRRVPFR